VVADGSKIGRLAFARICDVDDVDELITDGAADAVEVARIEGAGVLVTRA
jgi:DeoR family transcriptional regulator of aga operon